MGHFSKVIDGIVVDVIVAEQSDIDSERHGDPSLWIQTSYNTRGGIHYDPNTNLPDGGVALRYNYGTIGSHYDAEADAFYAPIPLLTDPENPCYVLNTTTYLWDLKPEFEKPETPVDGVDYWVFVEQRREWIYMDENYVPPTQQNNP
jgi:hypothetical protein